MAMIEIDLGEFVDGLIAKKACDGTVDEMERARAKRELLTIADKAVDVAIMRALFRNVLDRSKSKRTMDRLYDLMQSGSKADTGKYLHRILPDFDEVIVDELIRLEGMYLSGTVDDQSRRQEAAEREILRRLEEEAGRDPKGKKGTP